MCHMSIVEIERELPNGLHDAVMRRHVVDYEKRILEFSIDVWVGNLDSEDRDERDHYESGNLRFEGLVYFVIEPCTELKVCFEPFSFSAGDPSVNGIKPFVSLPESPSGTFRTYFFVYKLNAFMHICASKVEFKFGT
jgi:hypothetical protein